MSHTDTYFCKKHDLLYGDHLSRCPICVGEEMNGPVYLSKPKKSYNKIQTKVPERIPARIPARVPARIPPRMK